MVAPAVVAKLAINAPFCAPFAADVVIVGAAAAVGVGVGVGEDPPPLLHPHINAPDKRTAVNISAPIRIF
jgi:hypothetical protein